MANGTKNLAAKTFSIAVLLYRVLRRGEGVPKNTKTECKPGKRRDEPLLRLLLVVFAIAIIFLQYYCAFFKIPRFSRRKKIGGEMSRSKFHALAAASAIIRKQAPKGARAWSRALPSLEVSFVCCLDDDDGWNARMMMMTVPRIFFLNSSVDRRGVRIRSA